jgi:diguanylate cyclase (GGDEF)-like protein/PAS domain S-box-containing protein
MNLKIEQGVKTATLLKYGAAVLALLLLFAYWIYRLRKEAAARQLVETALRQSETKLRAILETEPECVKVTDIEGRLMYMNRSGLVMIEAENDPSLVIGEEVDFLVVPQDRPAFNEMNRRVLQEGQEGKLEFEIEGLKGTRRHMETHATLFRDGARGAMSVLAVTRDITGRKNAELQLRQSEAKFRAIIEASPIPYALNDGKRNITFLNRAFIETFGYAQEDIPSLADWWPKAYPDPEYRRWAAATWQSRLEKAAREKAAFEPLELNIRCKNSAVRTAMVSAAALGESLEGTHLMILYDITERKKNEEKLILAARVFSEAHEAIVITDAHGTIVDVNPTYCEVTGYSRAETVGKNPNILKSGKQSPEFYAAMWKTLSEEGHWQGEIWNRKKNGEIYPELLTVSALRDEAGKVINYIGLFSDITQLKHQQQALELMAHYDPLTRLPNRILFADRFAQAVARCKREKNLLGICYLDLDGFKPVNDTYGHEAGDQLLIAVAERIKTVLREEDTLSRLGGDEFALLLVDLESIEQFENALARIHQTIARPIAINGQQIAVSASSGMTIYPVDDNDSDTLLRHADQAMYQAKLAGRNCYRLFDPVHNKHLYKRREALSHIEQALFQGQFCLYYQPKINMKTAEVVGAEALIRWKHPERGVLLPAEFLPVIEGTSLEIALGNWVIEEVLRQLAEWQKTGLTIQVSLNIAPRHLQWKGFIKELGAALTRYPQIDSRLLELEVLESSVLVDLISAGNTLKECYQTLGVPFALDDFGTGYSSLTHLRHLPVSTVKIDQSFVYNMIDNTDDLAIVEGVIGLARAFRREVIAEGVETMEHGLILLNIGCHIAQGYAVAQAMPAGDVPAWTRNYRPYEEWLASARAPLSAKQAQMLMINIELYTFVRRIEAHLRTPDDLSLRWPLQNPKKSHLGNWIIQSRKNESAARNVLDDLQNAHEKLLHSGNHIKQQFQEGTIEAAPAEIEELTAMRLKIAAMLDRL